MPPRALGIAARAAIVVLFGKPPIRPATAAEDGMPAVPSAFNHAQRQTLQSLAAAAGGDPPLSRP